MKDKVNSELLQNIAHLARLEFEAESEEKMIADLNLILDWMEKLDELDTSNVEPLIHISEEINQVREDKAEEALEHEKGLASAPKRDSDYFRVPKVLE